jgi:Protein of unknown function DUF86
MPSDTASAGLGRHRASHRSCRPLTTGLDYEAFVADPRTVYAVTRCLEIISEASRRLPDNVKARHPSIAWKDMAGAGNIYRVAAAHQAAHDELLDPLAPWGHIVPAGGERLYPETRSRHVARQAGE